MSRQNNYYERRKWKKERFEELAEKNEQAAQARFKAADESTYWLAPGQPILIGHHSEKRHRAMIDRLHMNVRKGLEHSDKADYYLNRAKSVGSSGISLDAPDAVDQLVQKLIEAEYSHLQMVETNKILRTVFGRNLRFDGREIDEEKQIKAANELVDFGLSKANAWFLVTPSEYYPRSIGYAGYTLTNSKGRIAQIKEQLKRAIALEEKAASDDETQWEFDNGTSVELDANDNRIRIFFPGKPSDELRSEMKRNGYRWSRYNGCWQRQYSAVEWRIDHAKELAQKY